jgi:surface protein
MYAMFYNGASFNQPLEGWNVSSVTDMSWMFYGATSFNQTLTGWNVSSVTDMSLMFSKATSFNQPLDTWDVSSVTNMNAMFYEAASFSQSFCKWFNLTYKTIPDVKEMFFNSSCANTSDPNFDSKISFCGTTEYPTCDGIVSCNSRRYYSLFFFF